MPDTDSEPMSEQVQPAKAGELSKDERLAAQLRSNLRKRKAQSRAMDQSLANKASDSEQDDNPHAACVPGDTPTADDFSR